MIPNMVRDVFDFHVKFGHVQADKPDLLSFIVGEFRIKFLREELDEYMNYANMDYDTEEERLSILEYQFDAMLDLIYVAIGTLYMHGISEQAIYEGWSRVQKANMTKMRATRAEDSKRGSTLDIIKPLNWEPPSFRDLLA